MQHSNSLSGHAIIRESTTSSTVSSRTPTNSRSVIALTASGLRIACLRVAVDMCANCSFVEPYWYMCRCFTIA